MKKMIAIICIALGLMACGIVDPIIPSPTASPVGPDPSPSTSPSGSLTSSCINFDFNKIPTPVSNLATTRDLAVSSEPSRSFVFGIKTGELGHFVVGYSGSDQVIIHSMNLLGPEGQLWGASGTSQPFTLPNPNIVSDLADGTSFSPLYGVFLVDTLKQSQVLVQARGTSTLNCFDEAVLKISMDDNYTTPGITLLCSPHFIYTEGGVSTTYSFASNNLLFNGKPVPDLGYVLFVPASIVGQGFTYLAQGPVVVADPVLGDEMEEIAPNTYKYVHEPETWTANPAWLSDYTDNVALFEMIDQIAGITDIAERNSSEKWQSIAQYFHNYFIKYYKAGSTCFTVPNNSNAGGIPWGLGYNGHTAFLLIAIDDSNGPISLSASKRLKIVFDASTSQFEIADGILNVKGEPVLNCKTMVEDLP